MLSLPQFASNGFPLAPWKLCVCVCIIILDFQDLKFSHLSHFEVNIELYNENDKYIPTDFQHCFIF